MLCAHRLSTEEVALFALSQDHLKEVSRHRNQIWYFPDHRVGHCVAPRCEFWQEQWPRHHEHLPITSTPASGLKQEGNDAVMMMNKEIDMDTKAGKCCEFECECDGSCQEGLHLFACVGEAFHEVLKAGPVISVWQVRVTSTA